MWSSSGFWIRCRDVIFHNYLDPVGGAGVVAIDIYLVSSKKCIDGGLFLRRELLYQLAIVVLSRWHWVVLLNYLSCSGKFFRKMTISWLFLEFWGFGTPPWSAGSDVGFWLKSSITCCRSIMNVHLVCWRRHSNSSILSFCNILFVFSIVSVVVNSISWKIVCGWWLHFLGAFHFQLSHCNGQPMPERG